MAATAQALRQETPEVKEIMTSEMAYAFMGFAYGLTEVPMDNPSWVWDRMRWDPWFGMAVYRDLEEKDDMLSSCLSTRKEALLARRRRVLPASDKLRDKKVATFIEETLESYFDPEQQSGDHFGFDAALYEMLDCVSKGVSIAEVLWGEASDRVYIKKLKFKPQHLFSFSNWGSLGGYWTASYLLPEDGPLRIRPGVMIEGLPESGILPQRKFVVRTHDPMLSNRWGTPLDRRAFWLSAFKRGAVKNWLKFLEKGTGSVVAKYRDGAPGGEKKDALNAARMVNEESAGAVSASTEIEVLQHVRATAGAYKEMTNEFCNAGIARLILGQTLTSHGSEGGAGSKALGAVHNEVRLEKVRVDARGSMGVINPDIVWPLVQFNFGRNVPPPVWVVDYDPQVDLSSISAWFYRLWQMKVPVSKNYVYNTFQGTEPEDETDIVEPPAAPQPPEADPAAGTDAAAVQANPSFAEGKKKMADVEQSAAEIRNLISGTLWVARPVWSRLMGEIVDAIAELDDLRPATGDAFYRHLVSGGPPPKQDWAELSDLLSKGALAGYLLGVDQIGWEHYDKLKGQGVQFCEAQIAEFSDPLGFDFDQKPEAAIEYFKKKKIVTRKQFDKLADDARSGSFTVSGVYRKQVVEAFKTAIGEALEEGTPQAEVLQTFRDIIKGSAGQQMLGDWHLENVFRTNVQMAYGVGRRQSMEAVSDVLPYWTYHAVGDDRTRPTHQALSGICLKSDNSFWNSHYPPWAFACRCSVTADMDAPEGYDPKSPSAGVKMAYDDDGAPAKAEIGTQVVDFNTEGFQGVQMGLREALERGARTADKE
jgi:SPP1 gp7 family putative phage head morphogenesis protein